MPAGVAVLERLGLAEAVGGAPFLGVRYHFGKQTAEGRFPSTAGVPATGRGQRRARLDAALFAAATAAPNVTAHTGTRVEAPLVENGRVVGLLVDGQPRRAPLTVAADGVHSLLRHQSGLNVPQRRHRFGARAHFRLAPGQTQPPWVDVFVCQGYELYVTPLPDGEVLVAGLTDAGALSEPIEKTFRRWRMAPAELAARLEGAKQDSPILCSSPLAARARSGVAPGLVLLGDAAGFLDPITGGGMTQALVSAEILTRHVSQGVEQFDARMLAFERERKSFLRDYSILTHAVLWLADHPRLAERSLSVLRGWPGLFSHLIGVSGGVRRLIPGRSFRPSPASQRALTSE
jgi:2-polyprenyl-6-methoxyphenol hydroxylase-like FAD-dependent oxidoreductase